jgi:anti-sigma-K factor RskA
LRMDHKEAYELLEAYVFGTLEKEEVLQVEKHLESGCDECNTRLREAAELSVRMAEEIPQKEPSEQVKARLFERIRSSDSSSTSAKPHKIRRFSWFSAVAAAAVIVLAVGSMILLRVNRDLRLKLENSQDVTALLNSPGMQFVDLEGVDPNPQAFGKVVMDPEKGAAVVYMYRLPQTPEGMEYQLWVMREGKPTSVGTFTVNEDGSAMLALEELSDTKGINSFLVTIEPEGGQIAPTGMMYLTGPNEFQFEN